MRRPPIPLALVVLCALFLPGAGLCQTDDIGMVCQHQGDGLFLYLGGLFESELINGPKDFGF